MKSKRNALGRGLEALIGTTEVDPGGSSTIREIAISEIVPNPDQPRTDFDKESLAELASSIKELGIVQPLTLRLATDGTHQIIAGERRWRAARMAGLTSVPAYVRTASDSEVTEMALIENIQRKDLNAIEVALAFKKLIDVYHLTQERLSERLGKNRTTITNHLRLLNLPSEIQLGLRDRKLDMGHGRALLSVNDPKKQLDLYNRIISEDLSVRRVEELAREATKEAGMVQAPRKNGNSERDEEIAKMLSGRLDSPVKVKRLPSGRGSITLPFKSDAELERIVSLIKTIKTE